jgi:hypothetical protein
MKNTRKPFATILSMSLAFLLLCTSCYKEFETRFGFDSEFNQDSHGITIMYVNNPYSLVKLEGEININKGEVRVDLINPVGISVYSARITSPEKLYITEAFGSIPGNWKLKYHSYEGTGIIRLHMNTTH